MYVSINTWKYLCNCKTKDNKKEDKSGVETHRHAYKLYSSSIS